MHSTTDREWKKWGATEPYYGVLGCASDGMTDPAIKQKFMATGKADLAQTMGDVEALFGPIARDRALDFGCGVGRIMAALLDSFDRVDGIDVSDHMIAEASKNTDPARANFHNRPSEAQPGYDFVHSFIVLQHIRPQQGIPIIRELIELTRPGGHFALHFTIGDYRARARTLNFFRYRIKPIHWLYNVVRGRRVGEPVMEMNRYPFWEVLAATADLTGSVYAIRYMDHDGPVAVTLMGRRTESPA